jgi:hypothetical protein
MIKSENQTFGEQLLQMIRQPGSGARMQSASGGGSVAGGNTGSADVTSRATPDGKTQLEWMVGDPWNAGYFFKEPSNDPN